MLHVHVPVPHSTDFVADFVFKLSRDFSVEKDLEPHNSGLNKIKSGCAAEARRLNETYESYRILVENGFRRRSQRFRL